MSEPVLAPFTQGTSIEKFHPGEARNRPHAKRIRIQGEDKLLGRVLQNTEYSTSNGIVIPNLDRTQDRPHCCEVVQLSPMFDHEKYPDVTVGCLLMYKPLAGDEFATMGEPYVILNASYIRGVYDWPETDDAPPDESNNARVGFERHWDERRQALAKAAETPSESIPSLIRVN